MLDIRDPWPERRIQLTAIVVLGIVRRGLLFLLGRCSGTTNGR